MLTVNAAEDLHTSRLLRSMHVPHLRRESRKLTSKGTTFSEQTKFIALFCLKRLSVP